jgi:serine/threonine-protein kinase
MPAAQYPPGTIVNDRYVLDQKLGSDGQVYEAYDRHLDTRVALKLLNPTSPGVAVPWDEAQRLERLRSRFLVDVINADVIGTSDLRFIVTPLLRGGDLESAARNTGLSIQEAVRYTREICSGIDRIHAAGMIHGDIKPANVLRDEDSVLVSDLQFCRIVDPAGRAERIGSFCTLAPEAAPDDGYCSLKSDVYSLAATAFYLLAGKYPVDHELPKSEQRDKIAVGDLRELRLLAPHVSQAIGTVVRRALNFDPAKRFESAESFANALTQAAVKGRDWKRVVHQGHIYCVEGPSIAGRIAVVACAESNGTEVEVRTRSLSTGRRMPGVEDFSVPGGKLVRDLQRLVKRLD